MNTTFMNEMKIHYAEFYVQPKKQIESEAGVFLFETCDCESCEML